MTPPPLYRRLPGRHDRLLQWEGGDEAVINHGQLSGVGYCWHWDLACCKPRDPDWYSYYAPLCNQTFDSCEGHCWASMLDPGFACAE